MNKYAILLALVAMVAFAAGCSTPQTSESLPPTSTPAPSPTPSPTPEGGGVQTGFITLNLSKSDQEGLEKRADEIYQRLIGAGGDVNREALIDAYQQLADYQPVGGAWRPAGPAPIEGVNMPQGQVPGSGRVTGIVVDPRDSDVVYVAKAAGGLWKTTDAGQTWRSLSDKQVPLFIGGLVMDPNDPDTLYALLHLFDGFEATVHGYLANGILRSRDAGETWELIGAEEFNASAVTALVFAEDGTMYASSGQIRLFLAPDDQPDFGIFKSTDGGDTWERLISCSDYALCDYETESGKSIRLGGFMDLEISSEGTLFTSLCNIECLGTRLLRSSDGGETWEELDFSDALTAWEDENGETVFVLSKVDQPFVEGLELAVAASDPNVLLAGGGLYFEHKGDPSPWSFVMRSTDGGDTWEWLPDTGDYCSGGGSSPQCTYDNVVKIDPTDASIMYIGGSFSVERRTYNWIQVFQRSPDGGETWTDLTPSDSQENFMHPDAHELAFDPQDPNVVWVGNDGGVYRTQDASAEPPVWETPNQGLNTLLITGVGLHPTDPDYMIIGLQDNGNAFTTDGGNTWQGASQGDGADAAVDPFQPDIVYSHNPFNCFSRNENGGVGGVDEWFPGNDCYFDGLDEEDNWLFYAPFVVDPNNEGVIYFPSNRVYKTEDRGDSWEPISDYLNATEDGSIQAIAVSFSDPQVLYVGLTDGTLWTTRDGGGEWVEVTSDQFPRRNVTDIAIDPTDADIAYAVFGGFVLQTPAEPGHVFRTTDGGETWENLSINLPDAPLSSVVVDVRPDYEGAYIGGALGVWVLQAGADQWLPYGTGMPFTLVTDLELNPDTGIMAASTFGRSVWVMNMP